MRPLKSLPSASASVEVWPGAAMSARTRNPYENAAMIRMTPYSATGKAANSFSPIHAVPNGTSDSQNSSSMFAHSTRPLTVLAACSRWWWLFQ